MVQSKSEGADVAVTGPVVPAAIAEMTDGPKTAKELDAFLRVEGTKDEDPDAGGYERIIAQVLSATSADIVLTPVDAMQAKDMVGIPLIFYGFDLNESEFDAGSPFYVSMQMVVAEDGSPHIVNCGHKKVIAQCVKLKQFGEWPYYVMFRERGVSKVGGTAMLELISWDPNAAPSGGGDEPPF
jgi:hypothetical protein